MTATSRPLNRPVPGFFEFPQLGAAPGVSPTNGARVYNDGTNLLTSIAGAAYVALAVLSGATFTGLVTIDTSVAPAFSIDSDAVSGTIARIRHDVATIPTGALIGLDVDLATNWTAGNVSHTGIRAMTPATTAIAVLGIATGVLRSSATQQSTLDVGCAIEAGTIVNVRWWTASTLSAAVTMLNMDGTTGVTGNSQTFTGIAISTPPAAGSASEAIFVDWRGTAGTAVGSAIVEITNANMAANLTGQLVGLEIDLTDAQHNNQAIIGQRILIPATTAASTALQGALVISSDATAARAIDVDVANTGAAAGLIVVRWGAATTLAATTIMLQLDGNTSVTGGTQAFQGMNILTAAAITNASYCANFDFRGTAGTAAGNGIVNVAVGAATTLTGQLVGVECDISTNVTAGANACIGQRIVIPATTRAATSGEGALVISSSATAARCIDVADSGTSGVGMYWRISAAATARGALWLGNEAATTTGSPDVLSVRDGQDVAGASVSVSGTMTSSCAQFVRYGNFSAAGNYSRVAVGISNVSNNASTGVLTLNQPLFDIAHTPTNGGAGSITDTTIGIRIVMTPQASSAVIGISLVMAANTSSAGYAATFDFRGTAGTAVGNGIVNVQVGTATTHTAQLVGVEIDIATNSTLTNNVAYIGQRILIPATTAASAALEGALVISSDATAARVIDVDIANTTGTPILCRYGAATTPNAVAMLTLDMSTSVTTNTNANLGLDVTMLAADRMTSAPFRANGMRVFVNAGIPIDANGTNGDLYVDTAGAKSAFRPTLYQRQSAVWVGIA